MKIRITKSGTYTISGITAAQYRAMATILHTANDCCFNDPEDSGEYYSNENFVCVLDSDEREALTQVCDVL